MNIETSFCLSNKCAEHYWGIGVGADHRQPRARQGVHGEPAQHADVAVAAADQYDISQHRACSDFHLSGFQ